MPKDHLGRAGIEVNTSVNANQFMRDAERERAKAQKWLDGRELELKIDLREGTAKRLASSLQGVANKVAESQERARKKVGRQSEERQLRLAKATNTLNNALMGSVNAYRRFSRLTGEIQKAQVGLQKSIDKTKKAQDAALKGSKNATKELQARVAAQKAANDAEKESNRLVSEQASLADRRLKVSKVASDEVAKALRLRNALNKAESEGIKTAEQLQSQRARVHKQEEIAVKKVAELTRLKTAEKNADLELAKASLKVAEARERLNKANLDLKRKGLDPKDVRAYTAALKEQEAAQKRVDQLIIRRKDTSEVLKRNTRATDEQRRSFDLLANTLSKGTHTGRAFSKTFQGMGFVLSGLGGPLGSLGRLVGIMGRGLGSAVVALTAFIAVAKVVSNVVGGIVLIVGRFVAAVKGIAGISPALFGGLLASLGVVKTAFSGVLDAVQALKEASKEDPADVALSLEESALSEKEASLALLQAQERIQDVLKDRESTHGDLLDAQVAEQRAALNLKRIQKERNGLLTKGTAEQQKLAEVLGELSPRAQDFAKTLHGINEGPLKEIRTGIQEAFFGGQSESGNTLGDALAGAVDRAQEKLQGPLERLADAIGGGLATVVERLTSPEILPLLERLIDNTAKAAPAFIEGIGKIIEALIRFAGVGSDKLPEIGQKFLDMADGFLGLIDSVADEKEFSTWLDEKLAALGQVKDLLVESLKLLDTIFDSDATAINGETAIERLTGFIKGLNESLSDEEGQEKLNGWFTDTLNFFQDLNTIVSAIADTIEFISGPFNTITGFIDLLRGRGTGGLERGLNGVIPGADPFDGKGAGEERPEDRELAKRLEEKSLKNDLEGITKDTPKAEIDRLVAEQLEKTGSLNALKDATVLYGVENKALNDALAANQEEIDRRTLRDAVGVNGDLDQYLEYLRGRGVAAEAIEKEQLRLQEISDRIALADKRLRSNPLINPENSLTAPQLLPFNPAGIPKLAVPASAGEALTAAEPIVQDPMQDLVPGIENSLSTLPGIFAQTVSQIATEWAKLYDALRNPVNEVIDKVYNNGIVKLWSSAKTLVPELPQAQAVALVPAAQAFASGGYVRGPGGPRSDRVNAKLSAGEYVLPAHVVRRIGAKKLDEVVYGASPHNVTKTGRFALGGNVMVDPGTVTPLQARMWSTINSNFPSAGLTSATRIIQTEGHPDYHNAGKAIDLVGPMASMADFIARINDSIKVAEMFYDPFGGIKEGQRIGAIGGHGDHVHWAMHEWQGIKDAMIGSLSGARGSVGIVGEKFKKDLLEPLSKLGAGIGHPLAKGLSKRLTDAVKTRFEAIAASMANEQSLTGDSGAPVGAYGGNSQTYARDIVRAAKDLGLPKQAAIIALMTAMAESNMRMLANHADPESLSYPHDGIGSDHDSVGLFQQRNNGAWGHVSQRMNAYASAVMFYKALARIPNWQSMDYGAAAQAVQVSAYPDAYNRYSGVARGTANALFQRGGFVPGMGTGDKIPALLEPGEFVMNRRAVAAFGVGTFQKYNNSIPRFQEGGPVGIPGVGVLGVTPVHVTNFAELNLRGLGSDIGTTLANESTNIASSVSSDVVGQLGQAAFDNGAQKEFDPTDTLLETNNTNLNKLSDEVHDQGRLLSDTQDLMRRNHTSEQLARNEQIRQLEESLLNMTNMLGSTALTPIMQSAVENGISALEGWLGTGNKAVIASQDETTDAVDFLGKKLDGSNSDSSSSGNAMTSAMESIMGDATSAITNFGSQTADILIGVGEQIAQAALEQKPSTVDKSRGKLGEPGFEGDAFQNMIVNLTGVQIDILDTQIDTLEQIQGFRKDLFVAQDTAGRLMSNTATEFQRNASSYSLALKEHERIMKALWKAFAKWIVANVVIPILSAMLSIVVTLVSTAIGTAIGAAIGGPIGALIGAALGAAIGVGLGALAGVALAGVGMGAAGAIDSFDNGGLAVGKGFMFKDTNAPELVLNPRQTRDVLAGGSMSRSIVVPSITVNNPSQPVDELLGDALLTRLNR